jgi:hypothetical protein
MQSPLPGENQWDLKLSASRSELLDGGMADELALWLSRGRVENAEIEEIVARGGMDVL